MMPATTLEAIECQDVVDSGLTEGRGPGGGKVTAENGAYGAMLGRMHRALARRVGEGDVEDLAMMVELSRELERLVGETVRAMREGMGYSWAELARPLGISRQAAQQKWGGG